MINNPDELADKRLETLDLEFLSRFPDAREANVYEFANDAEGEAARIVLLAVALKAGRRARVVRVAWKGKTRVIAGA